MPGLPHGDEPPQESAGPPPQGARAARLPPAPAWPRAWHEVLEERGGAGGLLLWYLAGAVHLWTTAQPQTRAALFTPGLPAALGRWIDAVGEAEPELAGALRDLVRVCESAGGVAPAEVAGWCERVMRWAVVAGLSRTAIHYAEAMARLNPASSRDAYVAGRLNREAADYARATQWFHVAVRLARLAGSETEFAIAHLGWGNLYFQMGKLQAAERHLWKAIRAARRNGNSALQAAAHHELVGVCGDGGRDQEAMHHADRAAALYPRRYLSTPKLAYDVGLFLMQRGYFSASVYLLAKSLPWLGAYKVSVLSALARAAAATREPIRYKRCAEDVLKIADEADPRLPAALHNLAEGARSLGDWERATGLASRARQLAMRFENLAIARLSDELLAGIENGETGDIDRVPERGGDVELLVFRIMKTLEKLPRPVGPSDPILFPQDYPGT
jgi:tetratricopeptide (TPR) repeat protein